MRILILSWRCIKNPAAGGSELYFHELAKRWARKGHEVVWFSPMFDGAKKEEIYEGIKIIRRGGRTTVYPLAFLEYISGRLGKFEVILDVENGYPFFSRAYARKTGIVLHIHHMHKEQWFKEFSFPIAQIGYFMESFLMPLIYKGVKLVTICESSADEIMLENISRERAEVVNPGIDFYKKKKFEKSKEPSVLFLNRVKRYKGVDTLLEAARILKKKNSRVKFWVAGGGEDLPRVQAYAKENGLDDVTFLGRVSEEKKRELMQKAWIFANPSFKEGWGIVNIEANYAGTLAVGCDIGGTRDSIIDGKTGLLFPLNDSKALAEVIGSLVKDGVLRKRLEKNAVKWAKNFDWDSKANQYLKILIKESKAKQGIKYSNF